MGNHRLYLNEPCEGQVGRSTLYKYEDGLLEITWHGERAWFYFPEKTAVMVKCEGALPDVVPLIVPKNFRWRSLWLCGIPKKGRCCSREEFDARVLMEKPLRTAEGNGWKIAWTTNQRNEEEVYLGWISGKVHNRDVQKMIETANVNAPEWFIKQVLGF